MVLLNRHSSKKFRHLATGLICFGVLVSPSARANILFEGYSKIMISNVHGGFIVQRYEFDPKKNEFIATHYLKTTTPNGGVTESLKARSSASLKPIGYQYTELVGNQTKVIDANFSGDNMVAVVKQGGKQQTIRKKIPKGSFLSSFLVYLMLQGKEGIKPGVKYSYQAVAEEDANLYSGEAFIASQDNFNGIPSFKVLNTFKESRFVSYVNHKGEILSTNSPVQGVSTELVANMQAATGTIPFSQSNLTLLFGNVPAGKENVLNKKEAVPVKAASATSPSPSPAGSPTVMSQTPTPTPSPAPTETPADAGGKAGSKKQQLLEATPTPLEQPEKGQGVPAGQGIIIKGDGKNSGQ